MAFFPFTPTQFLAVFARYNLAVFPLQLVFVLLAVIAVVLTIKTFRYSNRLIFFILGIFWLWMGVVYHLLFFSAINPLAYLFGALFILEAAVLFYFGALREQTGFRLTSDAFSLAALVFIIYSLVFYPLIGSILGHPYPQLPTFGLPCPTTIFTFGIFLLADRRCPWYFLVVPVIWACIGFFAALSLGITEDFGLIVAGLAGMALIGLKNRKYFGK